MAFNVTWSVFGKAETEKLLVCPDRKSCNATLQEVLTSKLPAMAGAELVEFCFLNLAFAKGNGFTAVKYVVLRVPQQHHYQLRADTKTNLARRTLRASTFLSIMIKVIVEDTKEANLRDCEDSFVFFKEMLLKHCVQRPPWSMGIFTTKDVDHIVTFVIRRCVVKCLLLLVANEV